MALLKENPVNIKSQLFTLEEVAGYLRVSKATVRRWTQSGKLKCYRLGEKKGRRLFSQEHINAFLSLNETARP